MKKLILVKWLRLCLLVFVAGGCATIATYDQLAYVQVTQVKVEVLALMDKSVNDYNIHIEEVEKVNRQLFKALEYERHRPKNAVTTKMWERLFTISATGSIDEKSMIPSYWAKWKKDGKERAIFIAEAKAQVAEGFDLIAELESKKINEGNARIAAFINN